jgi:hypothetical protein
MQIELSRNELLTLIRALKELWGYPTQLESKLLDELNRLDLGALSGVVVNSLSDPADAADDGPEVNLIKYFKIFSEGSMLGIKLHTNFWRN